MPRDARVVLSYVLDEGPKFLWEPIFTKLGAANLLDEVEGYPKRPLIERFMEKKPLVIVLGEIEAWYDGISDEVRPARNRNFLQILTEMATSPGFPLSLIISTSPLARSPDIRSLVDRSFEEKRELLQAFGLRVRVRGDRSYECFGALPAICEIFPTLRSWTG